MNFFNNSDDFNPEGIEFKDFTIGCRFQSGSGTWTCTDIGTKTIIAYKEIGYNKNISWDEQDNIVFYWYDFGGLTKL